MLCAEIRCLWTPSPARPFRRDGTGRASHMTVVSGTPARRPVVAWQPSTWRSRSGSWLSELPARARRDRPAGTGDCCAGWPAQRARAWRAVSARSFNCSPWREVMAAGATADPGHGGPRMARGERRRAHSRCRPSSTRRRVAKSAGGWPGLPRAAGSVPPRTGAGGGAGARAPREGCRAAGAAPGPGSGRCGGQRAGVFPRGSAPGEGSCCPRGQRRRGNRPGRPAGSCRRSPRRGLRVPGDRLRA